MGSRQTGQSRNDLTRVSQSGKITLPLSLGEAMSFVEGYSTLLLALLSLRACLARVMNIQQIRHLTMMMTMMCLVYKQHNEHLNDSQYQGMNYWVLQLKQAN